MTSLRQTIAKNPIFYLETLKKINISSISPQTYSIQDSLKVLLDLEVEEEVQKRKCDQQTKLKYVKLCQSALINLFNVKSENSQIYKKQQQLIKKRKQIEYQQSFIDMMRKQVREQRSKLSAILINQKRKRANSIRNQPIKVQNRDQSSNIRKTVDRASSVTRPSVPLKDQQIDINITVKTGQSFKIKGRNFKRAQKNQVQNKQKQKQKDQTISKSQQIQSHLRESQRNRFKLYQDKVIFGSKISESKIMKEQKKIDFVQEVQVVDFDLDMPLTLSVLSIKQLKEKKQSQISYPGIQWGSDPKIKITSSTLKQAADSVQNQQDDELAGLQLKQKSIQSVNSDVEIDVSSDQDEGYPQKEIFNLNQSCKIIPSNYSIKPPSKFGMRDSFNRQIQKMDLHSRGILNKIKLQKELQEIDQEMDLKATLKSQNIKRKF